MQNRQEHKITLKKVVFLLSLFMYLIGYTQNKEDIVLLLIQQSKEGANEKNRNDLLTEAYQITQNVEPDSLRLSYLSTLSLATLNRGNSNLFKEINTATIQLGKQLADSVIIAEAFWDLATFYDRKSIKDSAYYSYSEAQTIYEAKGNFFFSGRMLLNMAIQQSDIKDYIGSETTTIMAIERFKPINKYKQLYNSYNNLGIVANALGEHERSIQYYNEALYYLDKSENINSSDRTRVTNNIGVVYRDKKEYDQASKYFTQVLATDSLLQKDAKLYSKALDNLAICKIRLSDTLGAYNLIQRSIKIKDSIGEILSLASSFGTMAEYNLYSNDTVSSIRNAKKSLELAEESSNNERLLETLTFLSKIDNQNASKYVQQYIALNDSLQKEERQTRNKFARIRFETDEFIAENEVLTERTELLSREKQMWTGIAIGFFLLGLSVYVIINQRAKNQKLLFQQQQQANNQEIFNLMLAQKQKVDEVKRTEQKRISEELHDGVLGKMLGARMVLTGLNKKSDEEAIQERSEAIKALKNVENEVRSISHELSHNAYQKINNFVNSIEALLTTARQNIQIKTIFNYQEDEDWDNLKGDIKINVYRIIQETLQNSIKHSNCENFFINFDRDDEFFNLTIKDDGKGFQLNKEKKGIGMRNIASRVSKLNGTWFMDSAPGKGTFVSLKIPIASNIPAEDSNKGQLQNV